MLSIFYYLAAMIPTETVIRDIEQSALELRQVLGGFSPEQFNQRPPFGGWSPGQTAEHILLFDILINRTLKGEIKKPDRPSDKKIPFILSAFEDLQGQSDAPEAVSPSDTLKDPSALTEKINLQRQQLIWTVKTIDLSPLCLSFVHPSFGELTRLEWIYFSISHTARHSKQLRGEHINRRETVKK